MSFQSLWVWELEEVRERLNWYYRVANNEQPAKFLICRRVRAEFGSESSDEELWREHRRCSEEFRGLQRELREGGLRLRDLEEVSPSLMDLKVEIVRRMLRSCTFCRWRCRVDRVSGGKLGTCMLARTSKVSSYFHHLGEELPIRGTTGSGTVFFTSCNMRCGFCQNGDISKDKDNGLDVTPELLAKMMWELRVEGCHNVNLVGGEPTVHLHTIVEAISMIGKVLPEKEDLAYMWLMKPDYLRWRRLPRERYTIDGEFNVPILWNSNMYMTPETLELLRELVDIWLPDFKFGNDKCSIRLARTPWYWETVTANHRTIYEWGEDMVIRHLVMPNHVECCTRPVLSWIAENMPGTLVNVMDQYHPDCFADPASPDFDPRLSDIARYPTPHEIAEAYRIARELSIPFEAISLEKKGLVLKF
ncbi:MAG: radical SAM protein [Nitrososphaerota archaeon]|nr:radical SAM protein [Nitrososphaerota archaeon]